MDFKYNPFLDNFDLTETTRVTALENVYVRSQWYKQIDSGTSGTLVATDEIGPSAEFVADSWPEGVDILVSTVTANNVPDRYPPRDAAGDPVTATFNTSTGAWELSAAPVAYPIALIYCYRQKFVSFTDNKSLVDFAYELPTDVGLIVRDETGSVISNHINTIKFPDTTVTDNGDDSASILITAADVPYDGVETVEEILDDTINHGVLDAITVTVDNGVGNVGLDISWTVGEIFDVQNATVVDTTAADAQTCDDDAINYLIWTTGTGLTLGTTQASIPDQIEIATISCQNGIIYAISIDDIIKYRTSGMSEALAALFPSVITDGLVVSPKTDDDPGTPGNVTLTQGIYYLEGHEKHTVSALDGPTLVRWYHNDGATYASDTNAEVDFTQWDNPDKAGGQGLEAVNPAKYYRSNFFIVGNTLHWIYPTAEYNTVAAAAVGGCPAKPPGLEIHPRSACLILRAGDTTLPAAGDDRWIDVRPLPTGGASGGVITDHGNMGGLIDDDHEKYLLASDATNRATFASNWADLTDAGDTTLHDHDGISENTDARHAAITLNASATTGGMSLSTQEISNRAATNAQTGYATAAHIAAIEANTNKVTNVSTNLSEGTTTETTVDVNSSDGDNATLAAASTIRAGVLSKAKFDEIVANTAAIAALSTLPGEIKIWSTGTAPAGYLECDGSSMLRATYTDLFDVIGVIYGNVDGTHFNLPDYRGRFLRGWDHAAGVDPNAATRTDRGDGQDGDFVGTKQADSMQGHYHNPVPPTTAIIGAGGGSEILGASAGASLIAVATTGPPTSDGSNGTPRTASETRPVNTNVMYIIKT